MFDHVKHIRSVQSPDYFITLSEENKKTFNHFMILRALSMDDEILQEISYLYRYFDKIPSDRFYQLLIALVPKSFKWVPWVKSKVVRHSSELQKLISTHYQVSKRQANEYINVLTANDDGLKILLEFLQQKGVSDTEIEKLFDKKES